MSSNRRSLLAALIFAISVFFGLASLAIGQDCTCVSDQVIAQIPNSANLPSIAAQYHLNPTPISQAGSPPIYLLQITNGQTPPQVVAAMSADTRISFVEVNSLLSQVERPGLSWTQGVSWAIGHSWAIGGSSKGYGGQWFPGLIHLNEAWAAGNTRGRKLDAQRNPTLNPVTVAVLDTGIDLSHPAFEGHLVESQKMWDFVDNDGDPSEVGVSRVNPSHGHGTHVAGIIALTAPDAKIMPIRILGPDGSGELWRVTAGVIWAAQHGAEVVNLSIGYPTNVRLLKDLIDCADDGISGDGTTFPEIGTQRLTIVAAAGNGGNQRDINGHLLKTYPAAERLDPMLGVGSSTRYDKLSDFSSFNDPTDSGGDWVNIVAPGEDIVSAIPGGRYAMWTGTSMAAPMVSGVAALVRAEYPIEIYPTLTSSLLAARLKNSAFQIQRYDDPLRGFQVRFGRLDALAAVSGPPPAPVAMPSK